MTPSSRLNDRGSIVIGERRPCFQVRTGAAIFNECNNKDVSQIDRH
jgi:hypothetical protein